MQPRQTPLQELNAFWICYHRASSSGERSSTLFKDGTLSSWRAHLLDSLTPKHRHLYNRQQPIYQTAIIMRPNEATLFLTIRLSHFCSFAAACIFKIAN
jgi:hypothetical protein